MFKNKFLLWLKCYFCQYSSSSNCVRDYAWLPGRNHLRVYRCSDRNKSNRCKWFLLNCWLIVLIPLNVFGLVFLVWLFYVIYLF